MDFTTGNCTGKLYSSPAERRTTLRCVRTETDTALLAYDLRETVGRLEGVKPDGGRGCFAYTSESAEAVGNLLNEVEWTVLKP